ncbi:hypothetical protein NL676_022690 [Syzygium grande]|nr:hypothetical protein NL676_022690 [Syzygium grande]
MSGGGFGRRRINFGRWLAQPLLANACGSGVKGGVIGSSWVGPCSIRASRHDAWGVAWLIRPTSTHDGRRLTRRCWSGPTQGDGGEEDTRGGGGGAGARASNLRREGKRRGRATMVRGARAVTATGAGGWAAASGGGRRSTRCPDLHVGDGGREDRGMGRLR